ncbi:MULTISPECIES: hypothetical protein [unclassified Tatumella]|uniref:hypothetical protein n=1 Tax=unclassified Tatumella TaxID=2649542 RepID=UPI001BAF01FE|nr:MULTISPECIES: hypothetical protein [unclassified Tatumella]MBS0876526.1 hypothetical protein [Tatumella sp. JGM82]MBS0889699.1 hypothetical protein [Tatumella sp. JGM94]MBS0900821.1 hypothetical protein [Tatumella sp. JGM100]
MCYKAKSNVATTTVSSTPITPAPLANTVTDDGIVFGDGSETSNDTGTKALTNNLDTNNDSTDTSTTNGTTKKVSAITNTNSL